MRKCLSDTLAGAGFLSLAVVFGVQLGELSGVSRVFPQSLIIFVALGGVYFLIKGGIALCRERAQDNNEKTEVGHGEEAVAWRRIWLMSGLGILYAAALKPLGFFTATFLFLVMAVLALGDSGLSPARRVLVTLAFAGLFCLVIWIGFVKLLNVPTPEGLFI